MRAAVLGSPIAHSLSPALHRAAYAALGLDWTYDAIEVTEAQLPAFIGDLDGTWAGLSLTMPLKESVMPLLAGVEEQARIVRAVNTVLPDGGDWIGCNTDIHGIVAAIDAVRAPDHPLTTATIFGGGATARSAIAAMARLGVQEVTVCARRREAAADVVSVATDLGLGARVRDFEPEAGVLEADVVISTVPGEAADPWRAVAAAGQGVLLDVAYHPWPSPLAQAWGGLGTASGREMLLWQAVEQVRCMTGQPAPVAAMRAALPAG